jgi:hypothetical protein
MKLLNISRLIWLIVQINSHHLCEVLIKLQHCGVGNLVGTGVSNRSDDILHRLLPRLQYLEVLW